MNWLNNFFHNFPVLCLGLATFQSSDGKPLGSSEPVETPTPAMRSEFQDPWFMENMKKLEELAKLMAETAKKQT